MTKVWKIVIAVAAGLLALGIVIGAAGWLTGASTGRIGAIFLDGKNGLRPLLNTLKSYAAYFAGLIGK